MPTMKFHYSVAIILLVALTGAVSAYQMGVWSMSREVINERETMRITIHMKQRNLNELDVSLLLIYCY